MKKYCCFLLSLLCAAPLVVPVVTLAADTTRCFNANGPKLSVQSGLVRDGLRLLLRVPGLKGDNFLRAARNYVNKEAAWKVPEGYTHTLVRLKNCTAELLHKEGAPRERVVLLLHGGAYILKLSNIYRGMAVRYSRMAGDADVFSPDYRLAPEHVFPAALDDAVDAWDWLLAHGYKPQNILVAGDSAGGNLALALTLKLRDMGRALPRALICMSPWTDMTGSGESHLKKADIDPIFGNNPEYMPPKDGVLPKTLPFILSYVGAADPRNPYLSPVFASYKDFPPMLIQVGTDEILESDSELVYRQAREAGVDATLTRYYGLFHVFQIFGNVLPESRHAWEEVAAFIQAKFLAPPTKAAIRNKSGGSAQPEKPGQ